MQLEDNPPGTSMLGEASKSYTYFMYEIKSRTNVVLRSLHAYNSGTSLTGYRQSDIELCFLQLRKILELMMFASLVAHATNGQKLQKNLAEKEWNAQKILDFLSRVNTDFFPQAIQRDENDSSPAPQMIPVEGALTRDEFGKLYNRVCGKYLHASRDLTSLHDHQSLFDEVSIWITKLRRLLDSRWIVVSDEIAFAVLMSTKPDGHVQVVPMGVVMS